jgi:hypothetical protein
VSDSIKEQLQDETECSPKLSLRIEEWTDLAELTLLVFASYFSEENILKCSYSAYRFQADVYSK